MKLQFKILSGTRAGNVVVVEKNYIGVGRHPLSDLRFDPDKDLDVSTRHAAILKRGPEYILRDLGSKNGTFANGTKLEGDRVVHDGDILRFGAEGPSVEFHFVRREADPLIDEARTPASPRASRGSRISGVTERIREEVARQTHRLRWTARALLLVLGVAVGGFFVFSIYERSERRGQLTARADSIQRMAQRTIDSLQTDVQSLADAFREAQDEARQLQEQLAGVSAGDSDEIERLRLELQDAELRQQTMLRAANVNYTAIMTANRPAVALVAVEYTNSRTVVQGTAFAVRSEGVLVTNKHVLYGDGGERRPRRIAIKFSGSQQWFEGRVAGVARDHDLAVIRVVRLQGTVPTVQGIGPGAGGLQAGDPVAIVGYPLGLSLPMIGSDDNTFQAEPTLTVGTISKVPFDTLQIDGYSAAGASGSPVFDRVGNVVGIVFGGQRGTGGKIVYALSSDRLEDFLRTVGN